MVGLDVSSIGNYASGRWGNALQSFANTWGMIQSAKQNKLIEEELDKRLNDLTTQFNRSYYTPFLQTEHGKSFLNSLTEQREKEDERISGASVVGGVTPEAQTAARESGQQRTDSALSKFAGYGTQYKDMKERQYNQRLDALQNYRLQHMYGKAQNWANFLGNVGNLGQSANYTQSMATMPNFSLQNLYGANLNMRENKINEGNIPVEDWMTRPF